ncbi:MAG: hypothetical protein L0229_02990 [Blastocatellia bacterium]|nr:hypothetical protein [Blastocatellia bacterium]
MRKTQRIYHIPLMVRFFILLVIILLTTTGARASGPGSGSIKEQGDFNAQYQQALSANPEGVSFNIRFEENKTRFKQGEIIKINLEFSSRRPDAYFISNRSYDRSGRLGIDVYHIDPQEGAVDPLYDYFHGPLGGFGGGGLHSYSVLKEKPFVMTQELNEWWRFDRPGKYRLYVTSGRAGRKTGKDLYAQNGPPIIVASNIIEFEVLPQDPAWAEKTLRQALPVLDSKDKTVDLRLACRTLRFLGSPVAAKEMIRRLRGLNDQCDYEFSFGLIGSPHRALIVEEMEKHLASPDYPVSSRFFFTLSLLSFIQQNPMPEPPDVNADPELIKAWRGLMQKMQDYYEDLRIAYVRQLASSVSGKDEEARAMSLITLLESINGLSRAKKAPDINATIEGISAALPSVFLDLPPEIQYSLLSYRWKQIASPQMLPVLRRIYENPPQTASRIQDSVLKNIYDLSPDEGRQLILDEIRSRRPRAGISALGLLPEKTLPELDSVLAENLEQSDEKEIHSRLLQRYASEAAFPRIKAFYDDKAGRLACAIQSPLLAYFLRVAPDQGAEMVREALASRKDTGCYRSLVDNVARLYMCPELERIAIEALSDTDIGVVAEAANMLGRYGSKAAEAPLWRRFEQWHEEWKGREAELRNQLPGITSGARPLASQAYFEKAMLVALSQAQGWLTDLEKLKKIESLCLTENGRKETEAVIKSWNNTIHTTCAIWKRTN